MSAKSNVNAMTDLKESSAKRIAKLVRLMSSEHDGEWSNAVRKLKLFLRNEGLTFNDLATVIENCDGAIEERRYSDMDAEIIFARGVEKGRKEERELPPEFYDGDGDPRWNEIALFCQKNNARLRGAWEHDFINDMAGKTIWREPTEKQAKHLIAIFIRLGGYYDPKAVHLHR